MLRRSTVALAVAVAALAGCHNYNFNPVGKCVIQPGSTRIQLASTATADLLFVVDDSGSMAPEQAGLARNFGQFIAAMSKAQQDRANAGLEPFEFHVAVTTSSIFESWTPVGTSNITCGGQPLQCQIATTHYAPYDSGYSQLNSSHDACLDQGAACNDLVQNYFPSRYFGSSCVGGVSSADAAYPQGNFVAAAGNPSVLHFTKDVLANTADATAKLAALSSQFQANINVGTCGSGMEQHFEAGRLAVEKALAGQQPNVAAGEWPHAGSKLVVVWLGDEDDCSNPNDPTRSLAFLSSDPNSSNPGSDVCIADQNAATHKMFPLDRYATYFTGLGRPFGAAFIYSAVTTATTTSCKDDGKGNTICQAGTCLCQCPPTCTACGTGPSYQGECNLDATPDHCSGKIAFLTGAAGDIVNGTQYGSRYAALSASFRSKGVNTFEASVCDANWGTTLQGIAQLVKPPNSLTLPTQPADSQVALLRIESADGSSSRLCNGPGAGLDWWFVDCKDQSNPPAALPAGTTSTCIFINHATRNCEPNPGESYIAQYLGMVPARTCSSRCRCIFHPSRCCRRRR